MSFSPGSSQLGGYSRRIPHRDALVLKVEDTIDSDKDREMERSHLATHVVSDPARLEVL